MQLIVLSIHKKVLRIIKCQPHNSHCSPLFKKIFTLKFSDKVDLENTLFASQFINISYLLFSMTVFFFLSDQHNYETFWPSLVTKNYGKYSIVASAIDAWNNSQIHLKISLRHLPPNKVKTFSSNTYFTTYWNELPTFWFFKWMLNEFSTFNFSINLKFFFSLLPLFYFIYIHYYLVFCWYFEQIMITMNSIKCSKNYFLFILSLNGFKGNISRFGYAIMVLPS